MKTTHFISYGNNKYQISNVGTIYMISNVGTIYISYKYISYTFIHSYTYTSMIHIHFIQISNVGTIYMQGWIQKFSAATVQSKFILKCNDFKARTSV